MGVTRWRHFFWRPLGHQISTRYICRQKNIVVVMAQVLS